MIMYQVKTEKMIAKPVSEVFRALKEGRLFMNCSADSGSMKIDFRVGGKYHVEFKNIGKSNYGEFLEIVPDKKIVFSWCQQFGVSQKPDTQVTIELFPEGSKTKLALLHTGFTDKEICDGHNRGWTNGINDLAEEMQNGRLRMVRDFGVPVEKLFESCKSSAGMFGIMGDVSKGTLDFRTGGKYQVPTKKGEVKGDFLEIIPNKKIIFSWLMGCDKPLENSKVTLTFNRDDDTSSWMELVHDGLNTEDDQKAHRTGWEMVTEKMAENLGRVSKHA
jgi:uncharacterized protein YndB with AHSA1/START domain